jgi:GNAT superfamily N-acetyltransferase
MSTCSVRRAERTDADSVFGLIEALAEFEKLDPPTQDARARFLEHGWPQNGGPERFQCWIAEAGEEEAPAGYAVTFFTYSSFLCQPTLYIEDIFVHPDFRRMGVATALMQRLAQAAVEADCGRMEWVVLDWNTGAQTFYQGLGAGHLEEWQYYRLDREGFEKLAGSDVHGNS